MNTKIYKIKHKDRLWMEARLGEWLLDAIIKGDLEAVKSLRAMFKQPDVFLLKDVHGFVKGYAIPKP